MFSEVQHLGARALLTLAVCVCIGRLTLCSVLAGTTGKISGTVLDSDGRPVVAATVVVDGQPLGAHTDTEGHFSILNVPSGTYDVIVARLGFKTLRVQKLIVSADQTSALPVQLETAALRMEEIIVTAERTPVELNIAGGQVTLTREEIEFLPVQELEDVVNLQAGVVEGHFRGGRLGEVQFQVDGVSVNNVYDNKSILSIDRSLLEEVQVISGTFDAEYGQAMSGVVNAVLRSGTPTFEWSAEIFGGSFMFLGNDGRIVDDQVRPFETQNYQGAISGPLSPNTQYIASGRYFTTSDYIYGTRLFVPTDRFDPVDRILNPTGDLTEEALGYQSEWSGLFKISNTSLPNAKLSYQVIGNYIEGRRSNYAFRLNPDGLSRQRTTAFAHGLDWTQTVSDKTFFDVNLRQNYYEYDDRAFDDLFDPRYDAAGPPVVDERLGSAVVQGVEFTRFLQRTNTYLAKASVVSQVRRQHQVKAGVELQLPQVLFGAPGQLQLTTVDGALGLVRHIDSPPDFPGAREYQPVILSAFAQDLAEWDELTLRAGVRLDYFDARATLPSDLANPANAIAGAPQSVPRATSSKVSVSPRMGLVYRITQTSAFHLSYGHFTQFPAIGDIFSNADYAVLANLQAGNNAFGVLGNPDVKPETTVQYEFGYKQALTPDTGIDVGLFFKDIRDLLGVEFVSTYNDAEYVRLSNADFGNVVGFIVSLDQRNVGPANFALDYTWQKALGNTSDPRETAVRAEANADPRPRQVPLNWDQRHTLNLTVSLARPNVYSISSVLRAASGQPFTPESTSGHGFGFETNSGRKLAAMVIDLRADRQWVVRGTRFSLFGRVFNLLDTRYFNGSVFATSGSPYYSRFPDADAVGLADPSRFFAPRRIEIGLRFEIHS